jgi:hypothetical protein
VGTVSDKLLASTKSIWLAAHFAACGLEFVRAVRLPGPSFRVAFSFADPQNRAPTLTAEYQANSALQRVIAARRAMAEALDAVRYRGVCEPHDIAHELEVTNMWAEQ